MAFNLTLPQVRLTKEKIPWLQDKAAMGELHPTAPVVKHTVLHVVVCLAVRATAATVLQFKKGYLQPENWFYTIYNIFIYYIYSIDFTFDFSD